MPTALPSALLGLALLGSTLNVPATLRTPVLYDRRSGSSSVTATMCVSDGLLPKQQSPLWLAIAPNTSGCSIACTSAP